VESLECFLQQIKVKGIHKQGCRCYERLKDKTG
jgi:hypothetical protein